MIPELVVFDCDGVLVDTETTANTLLAKWLTEAGIPTTMRQSRARFMGRTMEAIRSLVLEEDGVDLGADFPARWRDNLPTLYANGVEPIDGVIDVLDTLDEAGIAYCVASAGSVGKMELTLGSAGLIDRLRPVLFSATMVKNGKPAPDLFLYAAKEMGFDPEKSVLVEDSKFGVMGGVAAGMSCFGYVGDPLTERDALEAAGATLFDDMRALPFLIGL